LAHAEVRRLYSQKAKELSPRSVDYVHVTLQKALNQVVRDGLVPRNVAFGERKRSSRDKEEARAMAPSQLKALLRAAKGGRGEALYVVAVHTGLRQGELLGLRWSDVDLIANRLSVALPQGDRWRALLRAAQEQGQSMFRAPQQDSRVRASVAPQASE
jgi:integrase